MTTDTEEELNIFIKEFQHQLKSIDFENANHRRIRIGWIGEYIVNYCIKQSMWELGYSLNDNGESRTFTITLHYGANENNIGGIDIRLVIIDSEDKQYILLIEVKNWNHYSISEDWFEEEIHARYIKQDAEHTCIWIVVIKKQSISCIEKYCINNNISIVPLEDHLTPLNLTDDSFFRNTLTSFIQVFTFLIKSITKPILDEEELGEEFTGKSEMAIEDLIMGKSHDLVSEKYGYKKSYVMKLASTLRKEGKKLPDRRMKKWIEFQNKQGNKGR